MNKNIDRKFVLIAAAVILFTVSCAPQQSSDDARVAIEAKTAQWQQSFNAGDGAAIAARYAADGQILAARWRNH